MAMQGKNRETEVKLKPQKPAKVVRALKNLGFIYLEKRGSHHILTSNKTNDRIVIPDYGETIPAFIIRKVLKGAGVTVDEFLKALADS